jgi:hypothetical protein
MLSGQPRDPPGAPRRRMPTGGAQDCYLKSIEILRSLENSSQLPSGGKATLAILTNHLANNDERMIEARDSRGASGK